MLTIGVFESRDDVLSEIIARVITGPNHNMPCAVPGEAQSTGCPVAVVSLRELTPDNAPDFDIFVMGEMELSSVSGLSPGNISCRRAILPGSLTCSLAPVFNAGHVITYGMSPRDTITLSSARDDISLAVQRDIPTISGALFDRREIIFQPLSGYRNSHLLAATGLAIITGVLT